MGVLGAGRLRGAACFLRAVLESSRTRIAFFRAHLQTVPLFTRLFFSHLQVGLRDGTMVIKTLPDFTPLLVMCPHNTHGHSGTIHAITIGPEYTFFTASADKKMMAWQITASLNALVAGAAAGGGGDGGQGQW